MEELEIAPARLAALLQGVVPCFEPHLARAYGDGLRLATRGGAGGGVAHEELHIKELVPLLSGSGEGRWLALHTLRAMQIAAEHDDQPGFLGQFTQVVGAGADLGEERAVLANELSDRLSGSGGFRAITVHDEEDLAWHG